MSKKQRWHETFVNTKTNKPTQKKGGKDPAALTVPASSGSKPAGSRTSKPVFGCGRSNSPGSRGGDSVVTGGNVGGSLKRGSLGHQGCVGHQGTRQRSHSARPALRLCSSRSFSSLHTSSLAAAPFMRSSRSLSRLDQRSTGDVSETDSDNSQVKKEQSVEKKVLDCVSSTEEQIRDNKDQCHGDNVEKMETGSPSEQLDCSSCVVSNTTCHHRCSKVKKQTRDGVYTLCAMTSGMRHNWVQAVLKNVKPTPDVTSSILEHNTQQKSQQADSQSAEFVRKEEAIKLESETKQSSDDRSSASSAVSSSHLSSPSASLSPSPINPTHQEGEGAGSDGSTSTTALLNESIDEHSNMESETERNRQQVKTTNQREEKQEAINGRCVCTKEKEKLPRDEQQTGQLVKELEQTQRELSRLQQLNRNLQDELQQEKEIHSRVHPQNELLTNSNLEQALALQRLQKINHDLRFELETQKRSQEEARENELRRRVDLLAQQAQLLVTGDATALAQAHLEQDRRRFHEQQVEWERCTASLKAQLSVSEEQRKEAEARLTQLQRDLQSHHDLQQEADQLQKRLRDATTQLHDNEKAQTQKDAHLQKHLMLLQASQDRERRSLATSLAQAEQHSQDLQERLDRAEQQVESLTKSQTLTKEIEELQQQLQEELTRTVSAVQRLQEEREQLDRHCQELQKQLSEADGEVSRLQSRLKTEETHYYNLEHSYESVSEELQLALGKVQQRESETQDIREGYERLLDRKEQELSEVLLKMEVLGNSLEETEVKLSEALEVCTCGSSQLKDESSDPAQNNKRQMTEPLTVNHSRPKAIDDGQFSNSPTDIDVHINDNYSDADHARTRSRSIDASYQYIITEGDGPERFMSVIQLLETKLYVTEEKLRDITQRLEEHQSHISCQDPHLCSQLTQSRATAQHLSLLLHSQAKQSQRFAQETENHCRTMAGRFHVALNIVQACRERLQTRKASAAVDIINFERQLATVAAYLHQGEKDAEKQQRESQNASKGEDKILSDKTLAGAESKISVKSQVPDTLPTEDDMGSVAKCLTRELVVVETMVSALQSQNAIGQLSSVPREDEGDVAHRYKRIISEIIALKTERNTQSGREERDSRERTTVRVCAEAELIYTAFKLQQQYESITQLNNQEVELQKEGLANISPPELAPYGQQAKGQSRGLEGAAKPLDEDESDSIKLEAEKEPGWLERLISRLQRRAKFLNQLCQEMDTDGLTCSKDDNGENDSAAHLNWLQEQAKLTYLSERLYLDLEQELQQSEALKGKLQDACQQQDISLMDEQEAFNQTLCQLQEDNSVLREELERAEQKIISVETGNQRLLQDIQKIEDYHEERMQKLETEFREKIRELQQIHEEEMRHLHGYYSKSCFSKEKLNGKASSPSDQTMKASCDQGFSAMEEMHRKLIDDLQQQHQKQVAALLKEKDQLLQEETAATMAAIVAMRRAHKEELEKSRRSQHIKDSADITRLQNEYEKGIQLLHKELEVLSHQHTQKCLENSQLSQELHDERKSLMRYQKENQELKEKKVILRAREAEMQFLRQEARSLREELKIARMDKIYGRNKFEHDDDVTWPPSRNTSGQNLDNTSSAAFPRKKKSSLTRQIRVVRSKSLKEGLSIQERMKLFESF